MRHFGKTAFIAIMGTTSLLTGVILPACTQANADKPSASVTDASKIKPAENKMVILPKGFTNGLVLINPPRAKDGFGSLSTQTIGSYNGLYKLLKDNGMTLGNVMRVHVQLAPGADGKIDYDTYMAAYKKFFGTKQVPGEPVHAISGVRSLPTPGQLISLEAEIAVPLKLDAAEDKKNPAGKTGK